MSDANEIVRQRQSAIRRELDRRGIALKAVSFDASIPYPTLLTYFPQEGGREPVMMPMSAVYACAEGNAIPDDLLSLLLPAGCVMVRIPEGIDFDEVEEACRDFLTAKGKAHRPDSPGGRELAPVETQDLTCKVAHLRAVAA